MKQFIIEIKTSVPSVHSNLFANTTERKTVIKIVLFQICVKTYLVFRVLFYLNIAFKGQKVVISGLKPKIRDLS